MEENVDADLDEYKAKQAEFDEIVRPILKDTYQAGGAGGTGYGDEEDYGSHHDGL